VGKALDLRVMLGTVHYVDLQGAGTLGRIQRLWNSYCGLQLRIDKLEVELLKIERKLVQEDPSFFEVKHGLNGAHSFPFRPELTTVKRSGMGIAARNAVILRASSLSASKICARIDSYDFPVPRSWQKKFPEIRTWSDAYRHDRCRPLVFKLISEVTAPGRRLL
jgi:hypothetical protein